ncbi:RING finger protein B-like isoform X2 [Dioscorea cayenensis subsp. rotundata]|uniref:RING finger protein B-like isoform X2 n=1 Tax=Dioscorea cayennensis subsp. rotundata TaxID=55577 RepID=A0AB40CAN4_DIOCR|nr:RING finger protein B-like isoform X2 [Dioscorea cayenensis subsp. rotundata]
MNFLGGYKRKNTCTLYHGSRVLLITLSLSLFLSRSLFLDLRVVSLETATRPMRWERVNVNARARETPDGKKTPGRTGGIWGPGQRWGHTLNSVKNGRLIYVFGGFYGPEKCHSNDVFVFDTVKKTWSKPMVKGIPPSPRDSHSCTTVGNRLFVYGGTDGTNPLDDLHILDTSINTWIPSPADLQVSGPDAREGHSAALVGKRLFIFGGCGKSNNISGGQVHYNDLYILDTEKLKWEYAMTTGHPPSPRDSHTCSSWKNRIIVLGGEDSSDCYLSDVHILDTDTLSWSQISTSGQMIAPRAGHTTVALGSNLFVFGGFTDDRNLYDDLHVLNLALPELDVLPENRHEKFSLKKEFKRKCQEESFQSDRFDKRNAALCHGTLETSETLYLPCYSQEGIKYTSKQGTAFQARITNSGDYGYAIETVIGGKLLRGLILASTAGFTEGSRTDSARIEASVNKYQPTQQIIGENQQKAKSSDTSAPDTNIDEPNKSSNAVEPLGSSIERPMNNEAPNNSDNQNAGNSCENSSSEVQPVPSLPTQGVDKEQDKTG